MKKKMDLFFSISKMEFIVDAETWARYESYYQKKKEEIEIDNMWDEIICEMNGLELDLECDDEEEEE